MYQWIIPIISIYSGYIIYKVLKCPKELEEVPAGSLSTFFKLAFSQKGFDIKMEENMGPLLDKHGIIRVWGPGGWDIIVGDPQIAKKIFAHSDIFEKNENNMVLLNPHSALFFGKEQIASMNGGDWKRMRKLMNPIFHQTWSIDMLSSCTREVIDNWSQTDGKLIPVNDMIQKLTLDVLGQTIFNMDFESVKDPNSKLFNRYHSISEELFGKFIYIFFPFLEKVPFLRRPNFTKMITEYDDFIQDMIEKRKQELGINSKTEKQDLLTLLIQASQENGQSLMSDLEIKDNLKAFFIAGHDTTSNTLTSTLYYLARYPEVQNKLRAEILQVLNNPTVLTNPTMDQLKQMDYLNMVIKESMRIMTTASIIERSNNTPFQLTDSVYLPTKTTIILMLWQVHHHSKYFPSPKVFDPERFRDSHSQESKQWQPFISGPRSCIGMTLSLMEQRVSLVLLLQMFEFSMQSENPDFDKLRLTPAPFIRPVDLKLDVSVRM